METIRRVAFCPHCGNRAPQQHVYAQEYYSRPYSTDGDYYEEELPGIYHVAVCETCNQILLYDSYAVDIRESKNFHLANLVWPERGVFHESVPHVVTKCYSEAMRIKHLDSNAFAVHIRRALGAICDDCGARKGRLQNRLEELASRGELPPILAEMTDVLRLLGNIGAHTVTQSVKPGYVRLIDDLFRTVVEYVYVAPSKLKELRDNLERLETKQVTNGNSET